MKPTLFLRSAAVLSLLLAVGHMMGKPWTPANDPLALAVVLAMKSHPMHVMGFDRTFMDFYLAFGLVAGIAAFVQAIVLWITAGLSSTDPMRARWLTVVFLLAGVVQTAVAGVYLFTAPLALSAIITLCLAAAVVSGRKSTLDPAPAAH